MRHAPDRVVTITNAPPKTYAYCPRCGRDNIYSIARYHANGMCHCSMCNNNFKVNELFYKMGDIEKEYVETARVDNRTEWQTGKDYIARSGTNSVSVSVSIPDPD